MIVEDDLVDVVKPGDFVNCVGVYRALASANGQSATGGAAVVATSIKLKQGREICVRPQPWNEEGAFVDIVSLRLGILTYFRFRRR